MDALLGAVLEAHGGLERWSRLKKITAQVSIGGPIWAVKGWPEALAAETLQRRMDYVTEILGATLVAHYTSQHRSFGGIVYPTRRRVFRRNPEGTSNLNLPSITIDLHAVTVQ